MQHPVYHEYIPETPKHSDIFSVVVINAQTNARRDDILGATKGPTRWPEDR